MANFEDFPTLLCPTADFFATGGESLNPCKIFTSDVYFHGMFIFYEETLLLSPNKLNWFFEMNLFTIFKTRFFSKHFELKFSNPFTNNEESNKPKMAYSCNFS